MNSWARVMLLVLLLTLPVHSFFAATIRGSSLEWIVIYRDILISVLIFLAAILSSRSIQRRRDISAVHYLITCSLIFLLYFAVLTILAPQKNAAMYAFRGYLEPVMLAVSLVLIGFSRKFSQGLLKKSLILCFAISLFSIVQVFFLKENFLISIGFSPFEDNLSRLHHSFYISGVRLQRAIGTFTSANNFSLYLVANLLVLRAWPSLLPYKRFRIAAITVIVLALILTFSKSGFLGFFAAVLVGANVRDIVSLKTLKLFLIGGVVGLSILQVEEIQSAVLRFSTNLLGMTLDTSIVGHWDSLELAAKLIADHWFVGVGFGTVGPRAVKFTGQFVDIETSYLAIWLDAGIAGLLLIGSLFGLMYALSSGLKVTKQLLVAFFVAIAFLPTWYELEIVLFCFSLWGVVRHFEMSNVGVNDRPKVRQGGDC